MTNKLAIRILTGDVIGTSEQTQEAVTMAVKALSQPDVADINVVDTIYRQAAIDAIEITSFDDYGDYTRARELIEDLPSAQPTEIVRCKDCYHYPSEYADCPMVGWFRNEHDFCSRAERRQE